jgi:hypothetical protein
MKNPPVAPAVGFGEMKSRNDFVMGETKFLDHISTI